MRRLAPRLCPTFSASRLTADAMLLESLTHSILLGAGAYMAGWLLEYLGASAGFGALIVLTGLNLVLLTWLGRRQVPQITPVARETVMQSIGGGVAYLRSNPPMLTVVVVSALINILVFPALSLMPVFARDVFERGAIGLGMLNGSFSLGSFIRPFSDPAPAPQHVILLNLRRRNDASMYCLDTLCSLSALQSGDAAAVPGRGRAGRLLFDAQRHSAYILQQ